MKTNAPGFPFLKIIFSSLIIIGINSHAAGVPGEQHQSTSLSHNTLTTTGIDTVGSMQGDTMTVLPVTFHSFTLTVDKGSVHLDWSVDTDDDFSHYNVERSTDGKHFTPIGIIFTYGISGTREVSKYQFRDAAMPAATLLYYRLTWSEKSGAAYKSPIKKIRQVKEQDKGRILMYPNPVKDDLSITLPLSGQGKPLNVRILGVNGATVMTSTISKAGQTESLKVGHLPQGFYVIEIATEGEIYRQKMMRDR